ncbi:hypothetical protein BDR03DRAFT_939332 [Suillus americanus]|nr:hypothetical protein BDR03DRAFT_939332 [Suillus americanus]
MQLNNFLQHRFRSTQGLRLDSSSTGPEHSLRWTVIAYCQLFCNCFLIHTSFILSPRP